MVYWIFFMFWYDNLLKNDNYILEECIGSINNNGFVFCRNVRYLGLIIFGFIDSLVLIGWFKI